MSFIEKVAIYIRISDEDDDLSTSGKKESESISNQRNMLLNFVKNAEGFSEAQILEFCDDGWSGKNFERPSVKEMLRQAREGKIQCIIVKDISRFGRDYLLVGNYLTKIFPFLGVRFISLNDNYDSARESDVDSLDTSVKTLIYDFYSRDLSTKIRNARKQRAEKGFFIGTYAPFGYRKKPSDHHYLLIDEEAAQIVQYIFHLALQGHSPVKVANILNEKRIPTRRQYKQAHGHKPNWRSLHEENFWTGTAVRFIIQDERYTGKAIYRKREPVFIGDNHRSVKADREQWVIVEDSQPAIISPEDFHAANDTINSRNTCDKKNAHPFSRKLYCGVCGHALRRVSAEEPYYKCNTKSFTSKFTCPEQHLPEAQIKEIVLEALRVQVKCALSLEIIIGEKRKNLRKAASNSMQQLELLNVKKNQVKRERRMLYEKLALGALNQTEYKAEKEKLYAHEKALDTQIEQLKTTMGAPTDLEDSENRFIQEFKHYDGVSEITRELVNDLLNRVIVYSDMRIEIKWNYQEEFQTALSEMACYGTKLEAVG